MSDTAHAQPLARWLHLLWGITPTLHLDQASERPWLIADHLHLPARAHWQQHCAAAAHAAAHLVYSPPAFDSTGLTPVTRELLALLEDARIEALAIRELPGLARLWRPQHAATPASWMHRLARALADPDYHDPHPWIVDARRYVFLDQAQTLLALRTPADLHDAAQQLAHSGPLGGQAESLLPIGDAALAYRDDHRWMWSARAVSASTCASAGTARIGSPWL
jgi:nitric oxide reductase NorD protein